MLSPKMRDMEKKYTFVRGSLRLMRKCQTSSKNFKFDIQKKLRDINITNKQIKKIKEYNNIHQGERCFIIATGPSLTITDMEKLNDEYTFGMNSICLAFDKMDFRPSYFGIQDAHVYEKVKSVLSAAQLKKNMFVSSNISESYDIPADWNVFPLNISYHSYQARFKNEYFVKFSDDCYRAVYDGYTITYSLIQIAVYMGFKEIYLLGADCNYEADKPQHFIEHGHYDPAFATAKDRMFVGYQKAKEYADYHDIGIFNATRGGMLEIFPRVDLDDVLGTKE